MIRRRGKISDSAKISMKTDKTMMELEKNQVPGKIQNYQL